MSTWFVLALPGILHGIDNLASRTTHTRVTRSTLTAFLLEKNEQRKIEEIQPEELNHFVSEFIVTVKRKYGQDYEPLTLRGCFQVSTGI